MPLYVYYQVIEVAWVVQSDGVVREPNEDEINEFFDRELDKLTF